VKVSKISVPRRLPLILFISYVEKRLQSLRNVRVETSGCFYLSYLMFRDSSMDLKWSLRGRLSRYQTRNQRSESPTRNQRVRSVLLSSGTTLLCQFDTCKLNRPSVLFAASSNVTPRTFNFSTTRPNSGCRPVTLHISPDALSLSRGLSRRK
jgi:hypothetical protein